MASRRRSGSARALRVVRNRHHDRDAAAQHVERAREAQAFDVPCEHDVAGDEARAVCAAARLDRDDRERVAAVAQPRRCEVHAEPRRRRESMPAKRCTSLAGTASASPPTTMLLMPTTRPCTSASGPPEFPGASIRSACTKREPAVTAACAIPMVSAFGIPSGCPTATSTSPTRTSRGSRTAAAGKSGGVDAQQRQIAPRVAALHPRAEAAPVAEHDLRERPVRDVRVRHDRAVARPDHAGARAAAPSRTATVLVRSFSASASRSRSMSS